MTDLPNNLWKSPVIQNRLSVEATFECRHGLSQKPQFWVLVPQADTKVEPVLLKNFEPNMENPEPHEEQQAFAHKLREALMREAHFNGLWLVGYTHPPATWETFAIDGDNCWGRLIFIWHDQDGDPQYTLESDLPFIDVISAGVDYYVGLASQAHQEWREVYSEQVLKSDMLLSEDQMIKGALEGLKDV